MAKRKLNILIGCERSGALRKRFRKAGFNAISVDLETQRDKGEGHIVGDVFEVLMNPKKYCGAVKWDLFICHPPCTALAVSGNAHYAKGKELYGKRLAAMKWTERLWETANKYACNVKFENPVGVLIHTSM